jgi:hypothetical protein
LYAGPNVSFPFWARASAMSVLGHQRRFGDVRVVSAYPPIATKSRTSWHFGFGSIVLQNSKMRCRQNFAARSSERVFADQMPCNELRKAVGWKTDQSCDPPHYCRMNAPAPLENFVRSQKQSFATQSAISELPHCKMIGETLTCACRKHRERCSEVRALSVSFGKFRCWRCAEGADQARKVWCDDGPIEYFGCRPGRSQH